MGFQRIGSLNIYNTHIPHGLSHRISYILREEGIAYKLADWHTHDKDNHPLTMVALHINEDDWVLIKLKYHEELAEMEIFNDRF